MTEPRNDYSTSVLLIQVSSPPIHTAPNPKRIFAVKGLNGAIKTDCLHSDAYWVHEDAASCKICRQCHLVIDYVLWNTEPKDNQKKGHDGSQS